MLSLPSSYLLLSALATRLTKIHLREINVCVKLGFRHSAKPSYQQNLTCAPNTSSTSSPSLLPPMEGNANANAPLIRLQSVQLVTFLITSEFTITYTFPFISLIVFWFKLIALNKFALCLFPTSNSN